MADTVEELTETWLVDAEELVDLGALAEAEAARVLATRKDHEYLLRRRQPMKSDFLRALEYDITLTALLDRRFAKLPKGARLSIPLRLFGPSRVHATYRFAQRRFRGQREWYADHVRFLKSRLSTATDAGLPDAEVERYDRWLGEALEDAVRFFPDWLAISAALAGHLLTRQGEEAAARRVIMRAVRNCDRDRAAAEHYKFEFLAYDRRIGRMRALLTSEGVVERDGSEAVLDACADATGALPLLLSMLETAVAFRTAGETPVDEVGREQAAMLARRAIAAAASVDDSETLLNAYAGALDACETDAERKILAKTVRDELRERRAKASLAERDVYPLVSSLYVSAKTFVQATFLTKNNAELVFERHPAASLGYFRTLDAQAVPSTRAERARMLSRLVENSRGSSSLAPAVDLALKLAEDEDERKAVADVGLASVDPANEAYLRASLKRASAGDIERYVDRCPSLIGTLYISKVDAPPSAALVALERRHSAAFASYARTHWQDVLNALPPNGPTAFVELLTRTYGDADNITACFAFWAALRASVPAADRAVVTTRALSTVRAERRREYEASTVADAQRGKRRRTNE